MEIAFRPIKTSDNALLHKWPTLDFVSKWYEKRKFVYDDIEALLSSTVSKVPVVGYMVLYGKRPIGYIHVFRPVDYPEYSLCVQMPDDTACIDFMIGAKKYIHKGLGKDIVSLFLTKHVFTRKDISSCIVGPAPSDTSLIRMYKKAGFTCLKTIKCKGHPEPEHIMWIKKTKEKVIFSRS